MTPPSSAVLNAGVWKRAWTAPEALGSTRSRDIENISRAVPMIATCVVASTERTTASEMTRSPAVPPSR